jgi:hypothetical protein
MAFPHYPLNNFGHKLFAGIYIKIPDIRRLADSGMTSV